MWRKTCPPSQDQARSCGKESFPVKSVFASQIQRFRGPETVCSRDNSPSSHCRNRGQDFFHEPIWPFLCFLYNEKQLISRIAFILYRQHQQAAVVAQNPGLANPEISKVIGDHWRNSPEDVKAHWKLLAEVRRSNIIQHCTEPF